MPSAPNVKRRRPLMLVLGLAMAVVVAAAAVGIARSRHGNSSSTTPVEQLTSLQQACQGWTSNSAPSLGRTSASASCAAMTNWMGDQMRSGHMSGTMMWGTTSAMRDTCRQWIAATPPATASDPDSPAWCDAMVTWMGQQMGSWDDWMMSGRRMGG